MSKLKNYLEKRLEAWVEFPGIEGFEVKLAFLPREELTRIKNKATTYKIKAGFRDKEEEFNSELFVKEFTRACILDWRGLTVGGVSQIAPVVYTTEEEKNEEVPYTQEDAVALINSSIIFDNWLNGAAFELETFRGRGAGPTI